LCVPGWALFGVVNVLACAAVRGVLEQGAGAARAEERGSI